MGNISIMLKYNNEFKPVVRLCFCFVLFFFGCESLTKTEKTIQPDAQGVSGTGEDSNIHDDSLSVPSP